LEASKNLEMAPWKEESEVDPASRCGRWDECDWVRGLFKIPRYNDKKGAVALKIRPTQIGGKYITDYAFTIEANLDLLLWSPRQKLRSLIWHLGSNFSNRERWKLV
jgi:hypothetical protein